MKKMICAGLIVLSSLAASAQAGGLVTGTTPNGIYLTTQTGTSFMPYSGNSFTINGQPIEARYVIDGMNVQVYGVGNGQNNYYNNGYNNNGFYNNNGAYNQNQYYNTNPYNNRRYRR